MRYGVESLSDVELLAIIIGSGTKDSALDIAQKNHYNKKRTIQSLSRFSYIPRCK